jgi:hypothetical protein
MRRQMESDHRIAKDAAVQRAANAFTLLAAGTAVVAIGTLIYGGIQKYNSSKEMNVIDVQS